MALGILNPFTGQQLPPAVIFSRVRGGAVDNAVVIADASPSEQHVGANTITDHPVEEGANISDHSRPEPDRVQIEAVVSNTPITPSQQLRTIQSGSVQFSSTSQVDVKIGATDGYAQAAYDTLRQLKDDGVLVTVVTSLRTYYSMAIESITVPRTAANFDALVFSIQFKAIRVVKNKLTRNVAAKDKRVGKNKIGAQTPQRTQVESSTLLNMQEGAASRSGGFLDKLSGAAGALVH